MSRGREFVARFEDASDAIKCGLALQEEGRAACWGKDFGFRIGIHQAAEIDAVQGAGPKTEIQQSCGARGFAKQLAGLGEGSQILVTRQAYNAARLNLIGNLNDAPPQWRAHGAYLLAGQDEPVEIFEVGAAGAIAPGHPAGDGSTVRNVAPSEEETLGWRPSVGVDVPDRPGWKLEKKLGQGGFGEVWLAREAAGAQARTFKFCFHADHLKALRRERTLFELIRRKFGERRDIARLHSVQFEQAPFYLEFEYYAAGDLERWFNSRPPERRPGGNACVRIVAQIAEALAAAHSLGILHKDIKSSNILIEEASEGAVQPRLTDFGVGALLDHDAAGELGLGSSGFTTLGLSSLTLRLSDAGTRVYMAPEVLAGSSASIQSDIYALGVLLYQISIGDFAHPLAQGWERRIDDELLKEDIAACVDGDPARRVQSAAELSRRLNSLDSRRRERTKERRSLNELERGRTQRRLLGWTVLGTTLLSVALLLIGLRERGLRATATRSGEIANLRLAQSEYERSLGTIRLAHARIRAGRLGQAEQALLSIPADRRDWEWGYLLAQARPELLTVADHESRLFWAEFSPDGSRIVTASDDGLAHVYNLRGGGFVAPLEGHSKRVLFAEFSPSGERLATSSDDGSARIWNLQGEALFVLSGHGAAVNRARFSPDGKFVATASDDHTALLWDARTGLEAARFMGHTDWVYEVRFSSDGGLIATASDDKTARIWDPRTGREIRRLTGHLGKLNGVRFGPDDRLLLTSSDDGTARIWDVATGRQIRAFRHPTSVDTADFGPDGASILTASGANAFIWNTATGDLIQSFPLRRGVVNGARFSPDGRQVITFSKDRSANLWSAETGALLRTFHGHSEEIVQAMFDPAGRFVLTASNDQTAKLWSLDSLDAEEHPESPPPRVTEIQFDSHDHRRFSSLSQNRVGSFWRATPMLSLMRSQPLDSAAVSWRASPDGSRAALLLLDGSLSVRDTQSGEIIFSLKLEGDRRSGIKWMSVRYDPDGRALFIASTDGRLRWVDATDGAELRRFQLDAPDLLGAADLGPRGELLLTRSVHGDDLRLAKASTGEVIRRLTGHSGPVNRAAFSRDGDRIVTSSSDGTSIIWDAGSGETIHVLKGHEGIVLHGSFTPNGNRIVTASADSTLKIWDAANGRELISIETTEIPTVACFSADARRLAVGFGNGGIRVFETIPWEGLAEYIDEPYQRRIDHWKHDRLGELFVMYDGVQSADVGG